MHTDVTGRIRQLSASVINKIAAGEVIERPASVVKELLENSVDALATRIDVDIEQGGAELIRIVDNGEGIHPDDVELAVASHATSKLEDADDLFRVKTMGFRGEALASIAEVSQFRIRTRPQDQLAGVEMEVHGGIVKEPQACGCPPGTQIEVRELFFNTPVRRKFLKTPSTEFGHISEQFARIALSHPQLGMSLRHNGKLVHELPATSDPRERLELFFGSDLARNLIPVETRHGDLRLWGYVAHPSQSKGTRKGQYLFLNGRWIQDRSLQHALGEAYRGLVMVGRYPIAFLFLEIPSDLVDVNVHPTKAEVRFQDSQTLYRLMLSTLRNRFLSMELDSQLTIGRGSHRDTSQADTPAMQPRELVAWAKTELDEQVRNQQQSSGSGTELDWNALDPSTFGRRPQVADNASTEAKRDSEHDDSPPLQESSPAVDEVEWSTGPQRVDDVAEGMSAAGVPPIESVSSAAGSVFSGSVRAMQIHDCYLVVETGDGITVIDQHALHERIMYEQLRRRVLEGHLEVQRFLIPVPVEFSSREAGLLLDQREMLAETGLLIEEFGGNSIALTGTPTMLARMDPQRLLRDVVELLETSSRKLERRDLIDKLLHMMSCKAAIKAGQRLSPEEIDALLEQRELCDDHHHCPHGRPTALKLTRAELDRQFGRLG